MASFPVARDSLGTITSAAVAAAAEVATTVLTPSGGDDTGRFITALQKGGRIALRPGTYQLNSAVPTIQPALPTALLGCGEDVTKIVLSASAPRLWDLNKTADGQTFQHITADGFTVDVNNVSHNGHALFGSVQGGVPQTRFNVDDVNLRNVRVINMPSTGNNRTVSICVQDALGSGTQYTITNINIDNVRGFGGRQGFAIVGSGTAGGAGLNVLIDHVKITRWFHDVGVTPTAFATALNIQIGQQAQGGQDIYIGPGFGKNSSDVGIELDNMTHALVEGAVIEDAYNGALYHTNFTNPLYPNAQRITFKDCIARSLAISYPHVAQFSTTYNNSIPLGVYEMIGCTSEVATGTVVNGTTAAECVSMGLYNASVPMLDFIMRDCILSREGYTYTSAANTNANPILINTAQVNGLTPGVLFDNVKARVRGTQGSTGVVTWTGAVLQGYGRLDLDRLDVDVNITGNTGVSSTRGIDVGSHATGANIDGSIRRFRARQLNTSTDTNPRAILIGNTTNLTIPTKLEIEECDFSGQASGGTGVFFQTTGQNQAKVNQRGNVLPGSPGWRTPGSLNTGNFTTATFTSGTGNQYIGGQKAILVLAPGSGTSITAVDIAKDGTGTTYTNLLTQASGAMPATGLSIPLDNGDYVKITSTGTMPTATLLYVED